MRFQPAEWMEQRRERDRIAKAPSTPATMSKQRSTLYNVERLYCKISSFRQSRNKLNMFSLFRHCPKDEISFDIVAETGNIVAKNGNNVEATFDTVERIVQLVAFDNVAWTLLLVWTGLKTSWSTRGSIRLYICYCLANTLKDISSCFQSNVKLFSLKNRKTTQVRKK